MKTELIIAMLGMAVIGSLAAFFVAWAKYDEQKKLTKEERDNYKAALSLHNTTAETSLKYDQYVQEIYDSTKIALQHERDLNLRMYVRYRDAQDRLSALLCPRNDHVWKDGFCVKCGRMQDG